jgi:molecular chaperone DnaJ
MNPRAVLGVGPQAGPDEIRSAFRREAARFHPDRNPGNREAARRYAEVSRAYEELTSRTPDPALQGFATATAGPASPVDAVATIVDTLLSGVLGIPKPPTGIPEDLHLTVFISAEEALRGTTCTLDLPVESLCPGCRGAGTGEGTCRSCGGKGEWSQNLWSLLGVRSTCRECTGSGRDRCLVCRGAGVERVVQRTPVAIPGVQPGSRLRYAGHGPLNPLSGVRGDLYIEIQIRT